MKIILTESQLKTVINEKLSDRQKKNALKRAKKLAPKFSSVNQFSLKYPNLYSYLRVHNLLDDAFPERKKYHPEGYWTPETIDQEAKKYSSRSEFNDKNQVACKKANEFGMLDMLFPVRKTKFTLDKSLELAKGFESPWDLRNEYPGAHKILKDNNRLKSSFPNYKFGKIGRKGGTEKYNEKSFDEWVEHAKKLVNTKRLPLKDIDKSLYHWLRTNGADMEEFHLPDPDESILFKRAEKYKTPNELKVGNGYLFRQIESIPGALQKLFPNHYGNSPIDMARKKLPNPNTEISTDMFIKKQKVNDKLDDNRRYEKSVMFTPVTESQLNNIISEEKSVRYFDDEEYGISEQIDWLIMQKEFIYLGQGSGHKLKLINNIIHNLQKIKGI
jgi:hypothetical protein